MLKRILKWLAVLAGILVFSLLLTDVWFETVGLPDTARGYCLQLLEERGISCTAHRVRAGIFGGVKLDGLVVWDSAGLTTSGKMLEARQLRLGIPLRSWLTWAPKPRSMVVRNATLYLPLGALTETTAGGTAALTEDVLVQSLDGAMAVTGEHLDLLHLHGQLAGVQFDFTGRVRGMHWNTFRAEPESSRRLDWQSLLEMMPVALRRRIDQQVRRMDIALLLRNEAVLNSRFEIDLDTPANSTMQGNFNLSDIVVRGVPIRKCKGRYDYGQNRVSLHDVTLYIGVDSVLTGGCRVDFEARTIAARARGSADPHVAYRFLNSSMPRMLAELSFPTPPTVDLVLDESPWPVAQWTGQVRLDVRNPVYRNEYLQTLGGTVWRTPGRLGLKDFIAKFDRQGDEQLTGSLELNEAGQTMSAHFTGRISPRTIREVIPEQWSEWGNWLKRFKVRGTPVDFDCVFVDSGLLPERWKADITLAMKSLRIRDLSLRDLRIPLRIEDGRLVTAPEMSAGFGEDDGQHAAVRCELHMLQGTLSGSGALAVNPPAVYRALDLPPTPLLDGLTVNGPPVAVEFRLDQSPLDWRQWRGSAEVKGSDVSFRSLTADTFEGTLRFVPGKLYCENIKATSAAAEKMELSSLELDLKTYAVSFAGEMIGDPFLLEAFIFSEVATDFYHQVWADFKWHEGHWPHLITERFYFREYGPGDWELELNSRFTGDKAIYRGLKTDRVEAKVRLELPKRAMVNEIRMQRGDAVAQGDLRFEFSGEPRLIFATRGRFDPVAVFSAIGPGVAAELAKFEVGPLTDTEITGVIYLRDEPRARIEGQAAGDFLRYGKLEVQNFALDWRMLENDLKWELLRGKLAGGEIKVHGIYDGFAGTGKLDVDVVGVNGAGLVSQLSDAPVEKELGRIDGAVELDVYRRSRQDSWRLTGPGMIHIRNAELWEAPILHVLAQRVGFGSLGQISELQARLQFAGDRVKAEEITTNGTILALSGRGQYLWDTQELDFRVYGQALKSTNIVPLVLKPLSWFFEAELGGTLMEPSWRLLGPVRRLLPWGG